MTWRAFELDPSAPAHTEGDMAVHLAQKYGMTLDEARASQARLSAMASVEGLEFHFERTRRANRSTRIAFSISHLMWGCRMR